MKEEKEVMQDQEEEEEAEVEEGLHQDRDTHQVLHVLSERRQRR